MKKFLKIAKKAAIKFCEMIHAYRLKMCIIHTEYFLASNGGAKVYRKAITFELSNLLLDYFKPKRRCPICGWRGSEFSPIAFSDNYRAATRCPSCMTYERHRLLINYLNNHPDIPRENILFIGPNKFFADVLAPDGYFSIDIYPYDYVDVIGDLGTLPFMDISFDMVICFRVLEHIPDDMSALTNLRTILKDNGSLFLSVPLYEGIENTFDYTTDRNNCQRGPTWAYPDHARDYSINDLENKITQSKMQFEKITHNNDASNNMLYKLKPDNDAIGKKMDYIYTDIVYRCFR